MFRFILVQLVFYLIAVGDLNAQTSEDACLKAANLSDADLIEPSDQFINDREGMRNKIRRDMQLYAGLKRNGCDDLASAFRGRAEGLKQLLRSKTQESAQRVNSIGGLNAGVVATVRTLAPAFFAARKQLNQQILNQRQADNIIPRAGKGKPKKIKRGSRPDDLRGCAPDVTCNANPAFCKAYRKRCGYE